MVVLVGIVLIVGLAFNLLASIALYRFPDVYTRLHGTTKCTTFGTLFTSASVIVYALIKWMSTGEGRFPVLAVHILVAVVALLVTNSTGAHAIARAAYRSGVKPQMTVVDRLDEKSREGGVQQ
ncbi:MAG: monovalent cation/H(+) antiporter subunit G [Synergistales bacterium]|nr:monovalent cation/H(+) antiporter subunit G [Synergistales bacterium]